MWDEIKCFLNARYVSAPEAAWRWRLFEKRMHSSKSSHTHIIRLPVHLENLQPVYFAESEERNAFQRAAEKNTMLTGWFELNRTVPEANGYLYAEIPKHFTWRNHAWQTRVRLGDYIISRMYSVSPKDVERFHLRLLLCHVKGARLMGSCIKLGCCRTSFSNAISAKTSLLFTSSAVFLQPYRTHRFVE
ncbi:uncharacterized protein LOC118179894 [Stegodyphus dumicola]|uniref:uncharacterized protein LOC118179894 n=1 Tax=Stegodyphus dumicola TaxID=202533 RepID=UPI0015AF594B|nr:uncharacterized protein LOC118179894 [Stegodyphus dumicola]